MLASTTHDGCADITIRLCTVTRGLDRSVYSRKGGAVTIGRSIAQDMDVSVRFRNEYTHDNRGDPLFSIDLNHQASLNSGSVSDELSAEFEKSGTALSENASTSIYSPGREWRIEDLEDGADATQKYVIRQEEEAFNLDVYRHGQHPFNRSVRSVTLFLSRDTRDYLTSIYDPVSGSLNTLSYEHAGGGLLRADSEFQRYTLDSSWFRGTWRNHVFAAHARAGYLNSRTNDDWFLRYERFYLGGIDTVRGYEDYSIYPPPRSNELYSYGGNKVFFANFEYRIPLGSQLTGSAFFDVGQVWDEYQPNIFKNINLRKGAGVGIRFNLLGMLARAEWGYGFDRPGEKREVSSILQSDRVSKRFSPQRLFTN